MSAAVFRSGTPSLAVPQTQNTAPVLEFSCLYTHDVRKKSKKWQDGFLRYHTFNKRIMVYDVPRNFVGDVHWKSAAGLQEGDEITLDDGTVTVEVGENVGSTQTDLTELRSIAKRSTREEGHSSSPARPPTSRNVNTPTRAGRSQPPLKHRSLNALLGSARGQVGRASLPAKSPFDTRKLDDGSASPDPAYPAKRLKSRHDAGRTPLSSHSADLASFNPEQHRSKSSSVYTRHQPRHVVDLSNDEAEPKIMDGISSGTLDLTSSSLEKQKQSKPGSKAGDPDEHRRGPTACLVEERASKEPDSDLSETTRQSPFFTGERGTLQITITAPKRKTLLCESQLAGSGRPRTASTTEPPKSQRQILQDRLERITKKSRKALEVSSSNAKQNAAERLSPKNVNQLEVLGDQVGDSPPPPTTTRPQASMREERTLRRTASDCSTAFFSSVKNSRESGTPIRIPAPSRAVRKKPATSTLPEPHPPEPEIEQAPEKRNFHSARSRKALQRSASLDITGNGTATVMLRRPFQAPTAPKPKPPPESLVRPDAWSREAFDLFEWRPPDWDEERWCCRALRNAETKT